MKIYLKAILPFYIFAGVKFVQMLIFPVVLLFSVRLEQSNLTLIALPYTRLLSAVVDISGVLFIIWAGFRVARTFNGSIWGSVTTGASYYLFSILFAIIIILIHPFIQALLSLLILGVFSYHRGFMDFDLLKSLFNLDSIRSVAMWTVYGTIGGILFNMISSRKKRTVM